MYRDPLDYMYGKAYINCHKKVTWAKRNELENKEQAFLGTWIIQRCKQWREI